MCILIHLISSSNNEFDWSFSLAHLLGKLHFITLNYTSNYTLDPKLFECSFCTLNYDYCYTLHPDIRFVVNLDGKIWHNMKRTNDPSSQSVKNNGKIILYHPKLYF